MRRLSQLFTADHADNPFSHTISARVSHRARASRQNSRHSVVIRRNVTINAVFGHLGDSETIVAPGWFRHIPPKTFAHQRLDPFAQAKVTKSGTFHNRFHFSAGRATTWSVAKKRHKGTSEDLYRKKIFLKIMCTQHPISYTESEPLRQST